ncbi:hypothetical protein CANARDRAFT_24635 [[Candida] arabinofermentans NRRL YB-2248]|uniref:Zinc finger PHD-type domain-containing protein n=1 Tax=[Candida] arabinofermentans NRRL YB-2248 TaxID=983967 RepID=A0A1E4SWP7_9ASCO|nr:hypothetical protein CANARDRAFT_24635 [[Candida] arabinofermentans NRRL YB-2248]
MTSVTNHPAENLSNLIDIETKELLLKTPPKLLIEESNYINILNDLRSNPKYCYIIQWLYLMKHLIKLHDSFDVITFEEELLGIATIPLFINNFKIKLIQYLTNYKIDNLSIEFDEKLNQILNSQLNEEYIEYGKLTLFEKIEIIYKLIKLANLKNPDNFRKIIDKFNKPHEDTRVLPIFENIIDNNFKEEYFMLEDCRLYYKKFEFKSIEIPKLRKNYKKLINNNNNNQYETFYLIEPKLIEFKCLTVGIYEFDLYLKNLKLKSGKKTKSIEFKLYNLLKDYINKVLTLDLKKRKQLLARKREIQMQSLLANRKRSSRLEEKELLKKQQDELKRQKDEELREHAAEIRAAKRLKFKESMYANNNNSVINLEESRSERLKKRQEINTTTTTNSSSPENWKFDCICGIKADNYDDGLKMINCDRCNKWQHIDCQTNEIKQLIDDENIEFKFKCSYCIDDLKDDEGEGEDKDVVMNEVIEESITNNQEEEELVKIDQQEEEPIKIDQEEVTEEESVKNDQEEVIEQPNNTEPTQQVIQESVNSNGNSYTV